MFWFLVIVVLFGTWLFRAYFMPFAPCRRCKGAKVNAVTRSYGKGKRHGLCGKCGGSGSRQVLGSRQVHRAVRAIVAARRRD